MDVMDLSTVFQWKIDSYGRKTWVVGVCVGRGVAHVRNIGTSYNITRVHLTSSSGPDVSPHHRSLRTVPKEGE